MSANNEAVKGEEAAPWPLFTKLPTRSLLGNSPSGNELKDSPNKDEQQHGSAKAAPPSPQDLPSISSASYDQHPDG